MITPLAKRIGKLADDVEKINGRQVGWELGKVANALIEQAKQKAPNDPVLGEVEPFKEDDSENILRLSPPEVAAILRQVAEAVPPAPMAMPRAVNPGRHTHGRPRKQTVVGAPTASNLRGAQAADCPCNG